MELPDPAGKDIYFEAENSAGVVRSIDVDPESFSASWSPLSISELTASVDTPNAMDQLLGQWRKSRDSSIQDYSCQQQTVTWPSRDAEMTPVFLRNSFVPRTVLAVRRSRPVHRTPGEAAVRQLSADDVEAAVDIWLEAIAWDAQFAAMIVRDSTRRNIEAILREAVSAGPAKWIWVAETSAGLAGLAVADPPEEAGWISSKTAESRVAYLTCMSVTANQRSAGIGTALAAELHATLQEKCGATATLLHYAALSPLSGPFWNYCGYRPLWTTWATPPRL